MLLIAEANKKPVRKLKAGLIKYFMQQAIVFHGIFVVSLTFTTEYN